MLPVTSRHGAVLVLTMYATMVLMGASAGATAAENVQAGSMSAADADQTLDTIASIPSEVEYESDTPPWLRGTVDHALRSMVGVTHTAALATYTAVRGYAWVTPTLVSQAISSVLLGGFAVLAWNAKRQITVARRGGAHA